MTKKYSLNSRFEKKGNNVQLSTLKKIRTGAASIALGTLFLLPNIAQAEEVAEEQPAQEVVEEAIQINAPEVYNVATRKAPSVEGITPEGAVEIRGYLPSDSEEYRVANILSENPFTGQRAFRLALPEGYVFEAGQEVRVTAVDEAGNESEATINPVIDSDALVQLTVDPIAPQASIISGTVNPDAESVHVYLPNGAIISATVQNDGTWSANLFSNASNLTVGETVDVRVRIDGNTHYFNDEFAVEAAEEAAIDIEESNLVVARLGYYGDRYYRATVTLVDENGQPVTGLTEEDFNIDTFGGIVNFSADGNVYRLDTAEADALRPGHSLAIEDGVVQVVIEDERVAEEASIDIEESSLVVARLGYYGDRYYRATVTLVDENGQPVTGLTEEDFNIDTFGGIVNFSADGNVYRLDTAEADALRPTHSLAIEDGVVQVVIEDERVPEEPGDPEEPEEPKKSHPVFDTHPSETKGNPHGAGRPGKGRPENPGQSNVPAHVRNNRGF